MDAGKYLITSAIKGILSQSNPSNNVARNIIYDDK